MESYKKLLVWEKSYKLSLEIYKITAQFPTRELYSLTSQMRRAAVSVPSNIAEGYQRQHRGEYIQFLFIARGSLAELETQILIAKDLSYLNAKTSYDVLNITEELNKMLYALISKLKK